MDSEENAEESTTTDGASQLEKIREIVKKAIAEMREAGLLAYSQGGFGDGGDFEVHLWRDDTAKSLHGGPYVVTIKGSNRNQSEKQPSDSAQEGTSKPKHTCITCNEGMDELIAKGQTWCCECCGLLVGTQDKHEGCGFNNEGEVMCNLCYTGQCDCSKPLR